MALKSYYPYDVISEIESALDLIIDSEEYCTPATVLRFLKIEECNVTRRLVIDVARREKLTVKASGRGYRIYEGIPF